MPLNKQQLTGFVVGMILAGSVAGVLWVYSMAQRHRTEVALDFVRSERDVNSILMLKTLNEIRQGKDEEAIRLMEVWVASQLRLGSSDEALRKAMEYQNAHCKDNCLGVE
jgi:hypothetical protein